MNTFTNISIESKLKKTFFHQLLLGFKIGNKHEVVGVVYTYALLWSTVITPNNMILIGFLQLIWNYTDLQLRIFRGACGIFGIAAAYLFKNRIRNKSLSATLKESTYFTALCNTIFFIGVFYSSAPWQLIGMSAVLFSRIGFYGATLSSSQIIQEHVDEKVRSTVFGYWTSLNNAGFLAIFFFCLILNKPEYFIWLTLISTIASFTACAIASRWASSITMTQKS